MSVSSPVSSSAASPLASQYIAASTDPEAGLVVRFTRPDVTDPVYIRRAGDDIYRMIRSAQAPRVTLDLASVQRLSAAALRLITALKTVIDQRGGVLRLTNVDDDAVALLRLARLHKQLTIVAQSGAAGRRGWFRRTA